MGNCIHFGRSLSSKLQSNQTPASSPTNLLVHQSPPAPVISTSSIQFTVTNPTSTVGGTPSSSGVSSASSSTASAIVFRSNTDQDHGRFQYIAIFDYDARTVDDLTIRKGDLLEITNKKNAAWWKAKNDKGQEGWIPSNYVAKRDSLESEPYVQLDESTTDLNVPLSLDGISSPFAVSMPKSSSCPTSTIMAAFSYVFSLTMTTSTP